MNAQELIRIHLELECKSVDEDERLYAVPCTNPDDLTRFYIAQHDKGYNRYCGQHLPAQLCEQLMTLAPEVALYNADKVQAILAQDSPCEDMYIGKSYVVPTLSPDRYVDAVRLDESHRAIIERSDPGMNVTDKVVFAIIAEGQIASTCESSRENEHAGEAWVQTLSAFRGRGYAQQVTAAWANHLQQQGKTPFYSHKLTNLASQKVAQRLGLIQYITDAGYV